ncbi:MAG: hypothetical protein N2252_06165 [Candidatus Kryptonium sp.]|nr:hypothetical protein [Candidatus Kryptonium sp.]
MFGAYPTVSDCGQFNTKKRMDGQQILAFFQEGHFTQLGNPTLGW